MSRKILLTLFILLFYQIGFSQPVISFDGNLNIVGDEVEILTDTNSSIGLQQALSSSDFKRSTDRVPNLQVTPFSYWIRFKIRNDYSHKNLLLQIAYPLIDYISFYELYNDSVIYENHSGGRLPFKTREVQEHQTFIYPLHVPLNDTVTCYVKVKSGVQLMFPAYIGTEESIFSNVLSKDLLFGIYLGIILVMIFYNAFIYFTTKDKHYFYYILYLFTVLLTQTTLEGYLFRFVLPNQPHLATLNIYISSALIGIAAIEFAKRFLSAKQYIPRFNKLSYIFLFVYGLTMVLPFFGQYNLSYKLILSSAGASALYVLSMAIIIFFKGSRYARYFLIAWSIFIVCVIIYVLKDFGILPYNNVTNSSLLFGSALEAVLLSFALADKINLLEADKKSLQKETLQAALENERIIREQNIFLEARVNERTLELQASNGELANTLKELQETEAQLVESEKMASLGQLTAGIAHEINNPINFVTSNVNPLKRDIDAIIEIVHQMEQVSLSNDAPEEKQKKIEKLKNEADFEYLKTEIDYLIKGINEGASRTAEIVKGLRVFSRLDEDDLKKADINEGLDSSLVIVNHLLSDRIEIEKNYSGIPMIECYPGKLNQVFLNMVSNAIHAVGEKYNGAKGGKLTLKTWNDEANVYVSIKDNGTGMDEQTRKRIFDPFFTTKDVGEGTGLGLSIAYNTIKKHNGSIEALSEPGVGSEFIVSIPIVHTN